MTDRPRTARPRRSVLYMPGSNARALEKAKTLAADALILDLEDSVAPDAKQEARDQVCAAVAAGGYGPREVIIRINALDTPWGHNDLSAACDAGPDAILVPKINEVSDIDTVGQMIVRHGAPDKTRLWAMMETPLAVLNAPEIARAARDSHARLECFVMGTNDLIKDTRATMTPDRLPALYWLGVCLTAARAYGIDIIDGVYNDFKNAEGFQAECSQGRALGMDGKTLIHPGQINVCNEVFSPSEQDVAQAARIIAAFDDPANKDKGVLTLDGKMIELLHADSAKRCVAIAAAIAEMSS